MSELSSQRRRATITVLVILAAMMQTLDTTIVNVALPYVQGSVAASNDQITWVLTSYITAAAIMTPPTGFLAARFGLKRLFIVSTLGFTLASMLCGMAESLTQIVAFRLLQGAFGAAMIPLSQTVLLTIYPKERHGFAMALFGIGVVVGPVLGPVLGGWLTENYTWRYVFYINGPLGIIGFLGMMMFLPESPRSALQKFDWFGFSTLSLAIGALQILLDRGEIKDWFGSTEIVIEALIAGAAFYLFLVHTFTTERPFMRPALFRDRNLTAGVIFSVVAFITLYASLALQPPYLQDLMNYPVFTAGLVMGPRGVGTMVATMIVGRFVGKVDTRLLLAIGPRRFRAGNYRCRVGARRRVRHSFCPNERGHSVDTRSGRSCRWRQRLQPFAEPRLKHRHFRLHRAADDQYRDQPCRHLCKRHCGQSRLPRSEHCAVPEPIYCRRPSGARCLGHAAGADHCLY
jgi:DHA2 family multidrug resistance protein